MIKIDPVLRGSKLGLHHDLLRRIIGSLRIEAVQEAVDAVFVASLGEQVDIRRSRLLPLPGGKLVFDGAAPGQCIRDLTERSLDRLLVSRDRGCALRLGQSNIGSPGGAALTG